MLHCAGLGLFFFVYKTAPDFTFQIAGSRTKDTIVRILPLGAIKPVARKSGGTSSVVGAAKKTEAPAAAGVSSKKKEPVGRTQLAKNKQSKKKQQKSLRTQEKNEPNTKEVNQNVVSEPAKIKSTKESALASQSVMSDGAHQGHGASSVPDVTGQASTIADDNTLYVTPKEFEVLQLQQQLQDAIEHVWVCPVGVDKNLLCEVEVTVDATGALLAREFIVRTGVYIYDNAVEEALEELTLPQPLWGRSIKIVFKP